MSRSWSSWCFAFALAGCSLLVDIDEDEYSGGTAGDGDDMGGAGASGDGDGDGSGAAPGGMGGGESGGSSSGGGGSGGGGSGGDGSGGDGSGGDGSGGTGGLVQTPEPIHYYPLDGNGQDAVGSADATVSDPSGWVTSGAVRDGGYEVSESSDQAYLGMPAQVATTGPFTISWWVFPTSEGFMSLGGKTTYGQVGAGWEILTDDTNQPRVRFGANAAGEFRFSEASLPEGQWVHLVFAYQQNFSGPQDRFKLYINGQLVEEVTEELQYEGENETAELRFGDQVGLGGTGIQPFSGFIDEVRIYDEYLSAEDVQSIYDMDAPE